MTLEPEEAAQFFEIWIPLLGFAKRELGLKPPRGKTSDSDDSESVNAVDIRDALWKNDFVLDKFVAENPENLSDELLAIAATWKHHVTGGFTILRQMKKHAIFIKEDQAYGVVGLTNEIDEIVPFLPIMVDVSLLPFHDRIISDGLFISKQIYLGGGIRAELNAVYKNASEGAGIITSLPVPTEKRRKNIADGNARLLKAFRASLAGAGLSDKMVTEHVSKVAGYAESLLSDEKPRPLIDADLHSARVHLVSNPTSATSLKRFAKFLFDTGRGNVDHVFDLQELRRR